MKQFYKLFREVLQDDRITRAQREIISVIFNRAEYYNNKPFYCYESWIASETKCSIITVKRAIKHFETLGYINITKNYNKKTRKTTNYYTVNFDVMNTKMVEETKEVVSGVDAPMVKEEVIEVVNTVKEENVMNNTNDEIPYDLLYPYEAEMIEAMSIPINDFSTPKTEEKVNNEEMINNVKGCLKKAANKDNKGIVYFPDIMNEYGYKYRDIVECVKELEKRGELTYTPTEKDSKLYHNYSFPKEMSKEEYETLKKEWWEFCVKNAKKIGQDGLTEKQVKSDMSGSVYLFEKRGLQKKDMVDLAKVVFDIVTKSVA